MKMGILLPIAVGVAVATTLAKRRRIRQQYLDSATSAQERYKEILEKFPPAAQAQIGEPLQNIAHPKKGDEHEPAS